VASVSAFVLTIGGVFLGQSLQAPLAQAAEPTGHQGPTPQWAKVSNWSAVWDHPLNEDSVYYSLDAAHPSTDQDGTEDILWEAYDWSTDMSTYKTRATMHWTGTSAGGGDFTEYQFSSMAIGRIGGKKDNPSGPLTAYFWSRDARQNNGPASCSEGYTPIVRVTSGESDIFWSCMPAPKGEGNTGAWPIVTSDGRNDSLFSGGVDAGHATGGEIDQYSGDLYVVSSYLGQADDKEPGSAAASEEDAWRFSVWDPETGYFSLSGAVQPGDWTSGMSTAPQERTEIWTNNDGGGTANPYTPADFALDADGNAYMYTGGGVTPTSNGNMKLVRMEPARDADGNIVDGSASNPWRYYVVENIYKEHPEQFWDNAGGQYGTWGNAFLNGQLLNGAGTRTYNLPSDAPSSADGCLSRERMSQYTNPVPGPDCSGSGYAYPGTTNMVKVDPLSATAKIVYSTNNQNQPDPISSVARDNASSQQAMIIRGTLYNDLNGDGQISSDEPGLAKQTVALYDSAGVLKSTQKTDSTGKYSFLTSGVGGTTYYVRPVQIQAPMADGVTMTNAVQTWGAGSQSSGNTAAIQCGAQTVTSSAGAACSGAISAYTNPDPALTALGSTSQASTWLSYATVTLATSTSVPTADFGFTTQGSYGDAAAGPMTTNVPSHVNGVTDELHLGASLGSYAGPANDNAAHNATDDGVGVATKTLGDLALQDQLLAATKSYPLAVDVTGAAAAQAQLEGWTTNLAGDVWNQAASWTASGATPDPSFQYQGSGSVSGSPTVQMRVNASTATATVPDNAKSEYSGAVDSTAPWASQGEIEDYSFGVTDSVYRPAVEYSGQTAVDFQVNGQTLTAGAQTGVVAGTPKAATVGQVTTVTATTGAGNARFKSATVSDTVTGQVLEATVTPSGNGASVSFTAQSGGDVTVLFSYSSPVDPGKSSLKVEPPSQVVGGQIQAIATIRDTEGSAVTNELVTFSNKTPSLVTMTDPTTGQPATTCTTGADGQCYLNVSSNTAGVYPDEVSATVKSGSTGQQEEVSDSPQTVTFTNDGADPEHSDLVVTPAGPLPAGVGVGNTYTATTTTRDKLDNLVPGAVVTLEVTYADGSAVNPEWTKLSATTCTTGDDGKCAVTLTSYKAGDFVIHSRIPNASGTLTDVRNSPASVKYVAGPPDENPDDPICVDSAGGTKLTATPEVPVNGTATATAYVTDSYCNPVGDGVAVNFGVDKNATFVPAGTTPQATSAVTGADSKAIVKLTDGTPETVNVSADLGPNRALNGSPAPVTFTPGPGPCASTSLFKVTPTAVATDKITWVTADGVDAYTGVITAKTCDGVLLPDLDPTVFTLTPAAGDDVVVSDIANTGNGTYTATMTSTKATALDKATQATVKAEVGGEQIGQDELIPFKAGAASAEKSTLTVDHTTRTTGQPVTATATALDAFNSLVGEGVKFTFKVDDANGSAAVDPLECTTDASSTCSVKVNDTEAETVVFHGLLGSTDIGGGGDPALASPKTLTFTEGPVSAEMSTLVVDRETQVVGQNITATATAKDAAGKTLGAGTTFSFTTEDADGSATLSAATCTTDASGTCSVTITDTKVEKVTLHGTVNGQEIGGGGDPALKSPKLLNFTHGPVDPDKSHVTVDPTVQTAGSPVTVTVTVRDSYDNPITDLTKEDFVMTGTSAGLPDLTFGDWSSLPDGSYTYYPTTSYLVGTFTVGATVTGVELTDKPTVKFIPGKVCVTNCEPIDVPGTPEVESDTHRTALVMIVNDMAADGKAQDVAEGSAYDHYGNIVPDAVFTVTDATTGALAGKLNPATQTSEPTGDDAKTTVAWTSTTVGVYSANAKVTSGDRTEVLDVPTPAKNGVNSIRFVQGNISAEKSQLIITPDHAQVVGSVFEAKALIVDDNRNPIAGAVVTFSVDSQWKEDTQAAQLSDFTCQTGADGTCLVTVTSHFAGDYQVHATVPTASNPAAELGGDGDPTRSSPQTITFFAGDVCNPKVEQCQSEDNPDTPEVDESKNATSVTVDPNNAKADGVDHDGIVVTTVDKYGNPVEDATVEFATSDKDLALKATSVQTDVEGKGTVFATSTVAGEHKANVTVDGKDLPQSPVTLTFIAGDLGGLRLTIDPMTSQEVGSTFAITASATDPQGNPLQVSVAFDLPENLTTTDGAETTTCATSDQGLCTIKVTSTKVGSYPVVGTVGSLTSNSVTAEFTHGPVDPLHSTAELIRNGAAYNGVDHNIVKVTARDRYDNPVPGAAVSSTPVAGKADALTIQPDIAPTGQDGTTEIWYSSTTKGDKTVDVTINETVTPTGSPVTMYFGDVVDPGKSSWTIAPDGPLMVGTGSDSTYTLTATLRDKDGRPVQGAAASFAIDHDQASTTWTPDTQYCVSNAQGVCSVTVSSTKAGTFAFTASVATGQIGSAQGRSWTPGPVCAECSKVTVIDDNAVADGNARDIALVEAYDQYNNPVPGQTVVTTPGDDLLIAQSGIKATGEDGKTTIWYSSTKAGEHLAKVAIGPNKVEPAFPGAASPAKLHFVAGDADPEHSFLTVDPHETVVDGSVTAKATIRDAFDNMVPDEPVTFTVDGLGFFSTLDRAAANQTTSCTTGEDGTCQVTLTDHKAETVNVHATIMTGDPTETAVATDIKDSPQPVKFTAGDESPTCVDPATGKPGEGSTLKVDPTTLNTGQQTTATAHLVDKYCNPVGPGRSVEYTVNGDGEFVGDGVTGQTVTVKTDGDSNAVIKITDQTPEKVLVHATINDKASGNPKADITGSPAEVTFTDGDKPNPPVITDPEDETLTNDNTPQISGTSDEPGDVVTVKDGDGSTICTATVQGSGTKGTWSCTPDKPMTDGRHEVTAVQEDPAGNVSDPSNQVSIIIDTIPPHAPTIDTANGEEIGGTVPDTPENPLDPGTTVTVTDDDGDEICTAEVQDDGTWSCLTPDGTPSGPIHAVATDPAGNVSDETTRDLDTTRPDPPLAQSPNGSEVTGSGDPGDTIDVTGPDGRPVVGCQDIPIQSDGSFVCTPATPLHPGDRITVTETDPAGNTSDPTPVIVGSLGIEFGYPTRDHGQTQTVTGTNFNPGEQVCLMIYSTPLDGGCQTADVNGTVHYTFVVPADFETGTHTGTLTGVKSGSVSGTFVVNADKTIVISTGGMAVDMTQALSLRGLAAGLVVATIGVWIGASRRKSGVRSSM
jgi:hypothetical protein